MNDRKLRLGILLDSFHVPAWTYRSIERIVNSTHSEFSIVILNESANIKSGDHRVWKNKNTIIYQFLNTVDEKIFLRNQNAVELKDVKELLSSVPIIKVTPVKKGSIFFFEHSDIEKISALGLDILIKNGFETLQGDILSASRYGVWSYCFEGYPEGFWEVVETLPETSIGLRVLSKEENCRRILYSSTLSTYPFSPARNRNRSLWLASSFLPRQIALLHRLGEIDFFAELKQYSKNDSLIIHKKHETPPSNYLSFWLSTKLLIKIILEIFSRIFYVDAWFLMVDFNAKISLPSADFKEIIPPKGRFWADPMVIRKNDRFYVFIEEFVYKNKKGHISVIEVDQQGNYSKPLRVLEKEYHLSYPCVFEWNDQFYMVPESAENKTIDLYECMEFPSRWEFKICLMDNIKAVDTTLFYYQGIWWLFAGISENEGSFPEVELYLFFSKNLFTNDWKSHPKNPVVSDVRKARPAGKIFLKDGKMFRPSQDGSKTYGYGFNLNEILVISETEYIEENVVSIIPNWDKRILGTHTYGVDGNFKIIDAYTRKRRFF
jgi:hypothetical protein